MKKRKNCEETKPQRPKRRRARKATARAQGETREPCELDEEGLDALYDYMRLKRIPRLMAEMARRRGANDVRPRDYYCCKVGSQRRLRPVCLGEREDCPLARRYPDSADEPKPHPKRIDRLARKNAQAVKQSNRLLRMRGLID